MKKLTLLLFIGILLSELSTTMTYQGKLTDIDGIGINDSYTIEFKLYNVQTGGTELWSETHTGVLIDKGLFTSELGSITEFDLAFDEDYWLEITVDGDVMTPRQPLSSASYAFRAMIADSVDGGIIDNDWTIVGDDIQLALAGNVGIGTAPSASSRLHVITNETPGEKAVFGEYSSGGVFGWLGSSLYGAYGEFDSYNYGALGTSGIGILAAGETYAGRFEGDISVTNRFLDSGGDGGTSGQVLSSTGTGTDWIDISGSGSSDLDFLITTDIGDGDLDTVLVMEGKWGLFRAGNIGIGNACSTNVNLGVQCTTGSSRYGSQYISVLSGYGNHAGGSWSTICGGKQNKIIKGNGFVGAGYRNTIDGVASLITGGQENTIDGDGCVISGGYLNSISDGDFSTISGGRTNSIEGDYSVIPGGYQNSITGYSSFAFGENVTVSSDYTTSFYSEENPGTFNIAGELNANGNVNIADLPEDSSPDSIVTIVDGLLSKSPIYGVNDHDMIVTTDIGDGDLDSVLIMEGKWGLFRDGNIGYGNACSTHVNLGVQSTSGTSEANDKYIVVMGGSGNHAGGNNSVICGGESNNLNGHHSLIGGGYNNTVNGDYSLAFGENVNIFSDYTTSIYSEENPGIFNFAGELNAIGTVSISDLPEDSSPDSIITVVNGRISKTDVFEVNDHDFVVRTNVGDGFLDSVLVMEGKWGLFRAGNIAYGNACSTHVNLGVQCTTGYGGSSLKYSSVLSGFGNRTLGRASVICGGESNKVNHERAFIGGGYNNTVNSMAASILGGYNNEVSASGGVICGGDDNVIETYSNFSFIGCGGLNTILEESYLSSIIAGSNNVIDGEYSFIPGGDHNTVNGAFSFAFGENVTVSSDYTTSFYSESEPGIFNIEGELNAIGTVNISNLPEDAVPDSFVTVVDGQLSKSSINVFNDHDMIVTTDIGDGTLDSVLVTQGKWGLFRAGNIGLGNACSTHVNLGVQCTTGTSSSYLKYIAVLSGFGNHAEDEYSLIAGGEQNSLIDGIHTAISGGFQNSIYRGMGSAISSGTGNFIDEAENSVITGGYNNTIESDYSVIPGGYENSVSGRVSFAFGDNVTVDSDYTTSFYTKDIPGTFHIAGQVYMQNYGAIGEDDAVLSLRNSSSYNNAYTGIRFKSHDNDAEENYKGAIYFERSESYGRGDIILATNDNTSTRNVEPSDARMVITHDGNVGIDVREPYFLLQVNGEVGKPGGGSWTSSCDRRLKDIHSDFDKGIEELLTLQPKYYNYKQDNPLGLPSDKTYIGLIAQDVQAVIPEAVSTNDKSDFLYLNNDAVIMAMLNGIKEHEEVIREHEQDINVQNAVISDLTQQVEDLRKENEELRKIVEKILNEK